MWSAGQLRDNAHHHQTLLLWCSCKLVDDVCQQRTHSVEIILFRALYKQPAATPIPNATLQQNLWPDTPAVQVPSCEVDKLLLLPLVVGPGLLKLCWQVSCSWAQGQGREAKD